MKIDLHDHIHIDLAENAVHMKLDQFRVRIRFHFHFDRTHVVVRTQRPEMRILYAVDTVDLHDSLIAGGQLFLDFGRRTLHQNGTRILEQRYNAERD